MRKIAIPLAIVLATFALWFLDHSNVVRRAAFDIGSGSIKCVVADVDVDKQTIIREIKRFNVKADFSEDLGRNGGSFSPSMVAEGMTLLFQMKAKALDLGAVEFAFAATEAFRVAHNGDEFIRRVGHEVGIPGRVVGVDEEMRLGANAAFSLLGDSRDTAVVWDLGAGSMKLYLPAEGIDLLYAGKLASVTFKDAIIRDIQFKTALSPNPISESDYREALLIAHEEAATVPKVMKDNIVEGKHLVVGIGPVHNLSIVPQLNGANPYTQAELRAAIQRRLNLSDKAVGGGYASTEVSNLILALGFMQELDIQEVLALPVTVADGLLVSPQYWPE